MGSMPPLLSFLLMVVSGWVHRHRLIVIEFPQAENRLLKAKLGDRRIRFTDAERALLARKAKAVGSKALLRLDTIVSPDTLLRWHRRFVEQKWNFVAGHNGVTSRVFAGVVRRLSAMAQRLTCARREYLRTTVVAFAPCAICSSSPFTWSSLSQSSCAQVAHAPSPQSPWCYHPGDSDTDGPSWLSFIGHAKDCLWSIDLFRVESIMLRSYWGMLVMDLFTRRIIGFGVEPANIDGISVCRMFNRAISGQPRPKYLSSDNDPLFRFHR